MSPSVISSRNRRPLCKLTRVHCSSINVSGPIRVLIESSPISLHQLTKLPASDGFSAKRHNRRAACQIGSSVVRQVAILKHTTQLRINKNGDIIKNRSRFVFFFKYDLHLESLCVDCSLSIEFCWFAPPTTFIIFHIYIYIYIYIYIKLT